MRLYDRPISDHTYDQTFKLYPMLKDNEIYRRLFFHLSYPKAQLRDSDSGLILVSEEILASIEYKEDQLASNHYKGIKLLEAFKRDVLHDLEWSGYSAQANKARAVLNTGFSREYQALLDAEKEGIFKGSKRYFLSGKAYNRANREAHRALQREDAFKLWQVSENEDALYVAQYLNNLPSRAFTDIVQKNMEAARAVASNLIFKPKRKMSAQQHKEIERSIRQVNLDILAEIEAQSQPIYKPADATVRLFTLTAHMGNLKTEVREVLTQGWVEVDLKSSQLAITATLWGVESVVNFLRQGGSIWREMFIQYDLAPDNDVKRIFKDALYAILFGADKKEVKKHITQKLHALGINQTGALFMEHWIIRDMLEARNKQIDRISELGGAYTVYGSWLSLADNVSTNSISNKYYNVKSILAQQAQAVELKIITSLFRLAADSDDFTITLYQFDGVSILFKDKGRQHAHLARMKQEVKAISDSLGIHIELVEK